MARKPKGGFFKGLIEAVGAPEVWENHKESLFFLFILLVFSFLPLWLTSFVMFLSGDWLNFDALWNHGEFFIYSAALLGTAIYMMHGYPKKGSVNLIGFLYVISWFLTVFSAVGFIVATIPNILSPQLKIQPEAVASSSLIFVVLALCITYYAHYYDSRNPEPDRQNKRNIQNIMDQLQ